MKKLNNYLYLLIFILIFFLAMFFPLTGQDLFWNQTNILDIFSLIKNSGAGVITSFLLIVLTKVPLIKCLTISVIATSTFILMKNIVNKKNNCLIFIALFFLLLLDKQFLNYSLINTTGFTIHFIGTLFLLIFINIFTKNSVATMNKFLLFLLGIVGVNLGVTYSFTIFLSTLIYMLLCKEPVFRKKYMILLVGEVIGLLLTALNLKFTYTGFSYNLLHEFIPSIRGMNFFLTLVTSALILFESIRQFNNHRLKTTLSVMGISLYLLISLLIYNDILTYITFVLNFVGSFYILYNSRKNKLFKYKILAYYLFKLIFIIFTCIFGEINALFLYLVDIIIILEIYDYLLPKDYLKYIWVTASLSLICLNIYIYKNLLPRHQEMNRYIKNELECHVENFNIPSRFKTDSIYKNIPETKEEMEHYIKFYNIDIYNPDIEFNFPE